MTVEITESNLPTSVLGQSGNGSPSELTTDRPLVISITHQVTTEPQS